MKCQKSNVFHWIFFEKTLNGQKVEKHYSTLYTGEQGSPTCGPYVHFTWSASLGRIALYAARQRLNCDFVSEQRRFLAAKNFPIMRLCAVNKYEPGYYRKRMFLL